MGRADEDATAVDERAGWPPSIGATVAYDDRVFEVIRLHVKPKLGQWVVLRRPIDGGVESRSVFRDDWIRGGYRVTG